MNCSVYNQNLHQGWKLQSTNGRAFNLTFVVFTLQSSDASGQCVDYLEISNRTHSERFCGSSIPGPFSSPGTDVWLRFVSDGSTQEGGFFARACCSVDVTMFYYGQSTSCDLGGTQESRVRRVHQASTYEMPHFGLQRSLSTHQRGQIRRCTLHTPMDCSEIQCGTISCAPLRATDSTNSFVGRR